MKITKNIISRDEAVALCPAYVAFVEHADFEDGDALDMVLRQFEGLKRGQEVIAARPTGNPMKPKYEFFRAKVTSINHNDPRAVDGPIVRVTNGEYSWRCDGDKFAWSIAAVAVAREAVDKVLAGPRLVLSGIMVPGDDGGLTLND